MDLPPFRRGDRTHLAALATTSNGVLTTRVLRAEGYSQDQVDRMCRSGLLVPVKRGTFIYGHRALSQAGRWTLAQQGAGDDAALDARSAACAWGLSTWDPPTVEIVAPGRRKPVPGSRIRVDRGLDDRSMVERGGFQTLSTSETLLALARVLRPEFLLRHVREAGLKGLLDRDELEHLLERRRGDRGVPLVRFALEQRDGGATGAQSMLEVLSHDILLDMGCPPASFGQRIRVDGRTYYLDLAWSRFGIWLEVDGPPHDDAAACDADRDRFERIESTGLRGWRAHWTGLLSRPRAELRPVAEALLRAVSRKG